MSTNQYADSSFWCFDTLFMPQQHPARDAQDTFFLLDPAHSDTKKIPRDYLNRVKDMHEHGGCGSTGWQYNWSVEESTANVMRTHTTATSARLLYSLAQEIQMTGAFRPRRFFSIDRVFRNETLDATHLAEFHQVEGLVADRGLTIGHLIGIMKTFYKQIGIEKLRFKPAYNPYTEPSMEIFGYHSGLKKWIEVGNSGMFRPEMLLPMGLPEDVSVIAWGLSLERPTMIRYGISNIRQLFGHRAMLGMG
ncbi:phenylalanine--trna ligase alpha subunit [Cystoisospora suis]|uniref:phenylalanine--tRNA ligase n=1 Tax=Cystoisospora suis TaxID=483139 RepID=A0A2C6KRS6_9APIC|nr:phenylalanine--trna ligase alpha subunit [Cystoisospora suis]